MKSAGIGSPFGSPIPLAPPTFDNVSRLTDRNATQSPTKSARQVGDLVLNQAACSWLNGKPGVAAHTTAASRRALATMIEGNSAKPPPPIRTATDHGHNDREATPAHTRNGRSYPFPVTPQLR